MHRTDELNRELRRGFESKLTVQFFRCLQVRRTNMCPERTPSILSLAGGAMARYEEAADNGIHVVKGRESVFMSTHGVAYS